MVEVDAADSRVAAVLSQQKDGKLHPCAFFSCALFFTRFHFSFTYRPGSRNVKPDALSWQEDKVDPTAILPATCTVKVISWEIVRAIREAQRTNPDPGNGPARGLFVPQSIQAHTACFTYHPGMHRTIKFLQHYFWWPSLTPGSTSLPVPSAPGISLRISLLQDKAILCPCPPDRGPTWLWTL